MTTKSTCLCGCELSDKDIKRINDEYEKHVVQVCRCITFKGKVDKKHCDMHKWEDAKKLGVECLHGNYLGWCDVCPDDYFIYISNFIRKTLAAQRKEIVEKIRKARQRSTSDWCKYDDIISLIEGE
jgi:hypothetical protein